MISNIIELHNRDHDKKFEINPLIVIITLMTVFWLLHIYFLSFQNIYADFISKNFSIKIAKDGLQLNEWGDYFAGFFAPVIFLWIVIGVYIQKSEFRNAVNEYRESLKFLAKQSINTDIQHKNTWFDRNAEMLEKYIDLVINEQGSLNELNTKIIGQNIFAFRSIMFDILNIVELNQYIITSLKNSKNNEESYNEALIRLETEYDILFGKNISSSKKIACKFYLHIYRSKKFSDINENIIENDKFKSFYNLNILTSKKIVYIDNLIKEYNLEFTNDDFIDIIFRDLTSDDINQIIFEEKINEEII
jgi:hypothetical protein